MNWAWVPPHLAIAWHERLILEFGGALGVRAFGLLEGALDQPKNLWGYKPAATLEELGVFHGVGVAKAHAFVNGNKRMAFAVMRAFLKAHGQMLDATEADATKTMLQVAISSISDVGLAARLVTHGRKA